MGGILHRQSAPHLGSEWKIALGPGSRRPGRPNRFMLESNAHRSIYSIYFDIRRSS